MFFGEYNVLLKYFDRYSLLSNGIWVLTTSVIIVVAIVVSVLLLSRKERENICDYVLLELKMSVAKGEISEVVYLKRKKLSDNK